jgi:uncharacterized protein YkwD
MTRKLSHAGSVAVLLAGLVALADGRQGAAGGDAPKGAVRSLAEVKRRLAEINGGPAVAPKAGDRDAERQAALRRLNAYRYLAGAPADVVLDDRMNREAEAAAALCKRTGRLDHKPANPGMPEDEYRLALKGTSSCNLHRGQATLTDAVDGFMADSDAGNIARLGHRRWCLNPELRKTGFGRSDGFCAMWSLDRSRSPVPAYDVLCFPARGPMPTAYFKSNLAWNVSLNPARYRVPDRAVKVTVTALDDGGKKGEALNLNHFGVASSIYGMPPAVIFRPAGVQVTPGRRYAVTVEGLRRTDGTAADLRYIVEFVRLD